MTKKLGLSVVAAAILATGAVTTVSAEDGVSNLDWKVNLRPRVETVTEDNAKDDASALTLKIAPSVKYKAGAIGVNAELVGVVELTDTFNNTNSPSDADRLATSTVADPAQVRPTQLSVSYQAGKTNVAVGREYVNIDEQRFVGAVAWRQMPQTFDGLFVSDNSVENLKITAGYITGVNKIFADNDDTADAARSFDTASIVLNAAYKASDAATVSLNVINLAGISDTTGFKVKGAVPAGDMKVNYKVEYAMQKDPSSEHEDKYGNHGTTPTIDATYTAVAVGVTTGDISAGVEMETLGADDTNGVAFQTPLATGHKFNGWADMWLSTPFCGLVDTALNVGYKNADVGAINFVYHSFASDTDSVDLGTEMDLSYAKPINKDMKVLLKYASYTASDDATNGLGKVDTTKMWVMLNYDFKN